MYFSWPLASLTVSEASLRLSLLGSALTLGAAEIESITLERGILTHGLRFTPDDPRREFVFYSMRRRALIEALRERGYRVGDGG